MRGMKGGNVHRWADERSAKMEGKVEKKMMRMVG